VGRVFWLTEPDHGSDPGSVISRAKAMDSGYLISGAKNWITKSLSQRRSFCRMSAVWLGLLDELAGRAGWRATDDPVFYKD